MKGFAYLPLLQPVEEHNDPESAEFDLEVGEAEGLLDGEKDTSQDDSERIPLKPSERPFVLYGTLVIFILLAFVLRFGVPPFPTSSRQAPVLEFTSVSPFSRLSNGINYNSTYFANADEITTPTFLTPIDRARPDFIYPMEGRMHFHANPYYGTLPQEDWQLFLNDSITSIVQFRVRDFGMERCRFQFGLPKNGVLDPLRNNRTSVQPHWEAGGSEAVISIWSLDTSRWLERTDLCYRSKPPRSERVATMLVKQNEVIRSTEQFLCPSDNILTYEIACESANCDISILQDRIETDIGFQLVQTTSL